MNLIQHHLAFAYEIIVQIDKLHKLFKQWFISSWSGSNKGLLQAM